MERFSQASEPVIPGESVPSADFVQKAYFDQNPAHALASSFTLGCPSGGLVDNQALLDADIIHLHDIKGLLSPQSLNRLIGSGKPIVWSLSDMWAFTGGCHQALDCLGYTRDCKNCVQLLKNPSGLPSLLLGKKRALFEGPHLHILSTSKWLAERARESRVFDNAPIQTVSPIANDAICPQPRSLAKAQLGLDPQSFTLLLVCENTGSQERHREALKYLLEACSLYNAFKSLTRKKKLRILILGSAPEDFPLDSGVVHAGFAGDYKKLSLLLSAADLAVLPHFEENGNQIVLEAARCGTPVLAMNTGGIDEVLQDDVTGRLVPALEPRRMAEEISYLALHPEILSAWSRNCLNSFEKAPRNAVGQYAALYQQLVDGVAQHIAPKRVEIATPDLREEMVDLMFVFMDTLNFSLASATDAAHAKAEAALRKAESLKASLQTAIDKLSLTHQRIAGEASKRPRNPKLANAVHSVGKLRNHLARILSETRSKEDQQKQRARFFRIPKDTKATERTTKPEPGARDRVLQWVYDAYLKKRHIKKPGSLAQYSPRPLVLENFPWPRVQPRKLPTIAMVTPSYMQGRFIEQTIRSVVDQGYPKLRYAIQDAASTDETADILKKYASRLTTWISEPDTGQARAVVSGFEKISGDIMAWLNSDDLLMPGALRYIGEYFRKHPEVDALYGHRVVIDENDREVARWVLPRHDPSILRSIDYVPQETLFWRSSLWRKAGGVNPKFRFALDWDLLLRFQNAGAKIVRVPYYLGCFRVHTLQKTSAQMETIGSDEINHLRSITDGAVADPAGLASISQKVMRQSALCGWLLDLGVRW